MGYLCFWWWVLSHSPQNLLRRDTLLECLHDDKRGVECHSALFSGQKSERGCTCFSRWFGDRTFPSSDKKSSSIWAAPSQSYCLFVVWPACASSRGWTLGSGLGMKTLVSQPWCRSEVLDVNMSVDRMLSGLRCSLKHTARKMDGLCVLTCEM